MPSTIVDNPSSVSTISAAARAASVEPMSKKKGNELTNPTSNH